MDRAEIRAESQCRKDPCMTTEQTEISWFWILQIRTDAEMGNQTPRKFGGKVPAHTQETIQTLVEHLHGCTYHEVEPNNPRMDKLLCHNRHERQNGGYILTSSNDDTQSDMETMEDTAEASMGTTETWHRQRHGKTHILLWKPLRMNCKTYMRSQSHIQRNPYP